MRKILETERLILRELNLDDAGFIIELLNSEGWLKYIGDRNVRSDERAINYLETGPLKSYETNGFGLSLVALKDTMQPIGMCGLNKRDTLDNIDIGFAFLPQYTGLGYAYEIVHETLKYGFEKLNLEKIVAISLTGNANSIRLLKKLGFEMEKEFYSEKDNEVLTLRGMDNFKFTNR